MIIQLSEQHIDAILDLQRQCVHNSDIFLPTSREGYLRAFRFNNFCFGCMMDGELVAFLNSSIPTGRSLNNLGRGRLPEAELDRVGHMNTLLVRRDRRLGGIGTSLVDATLKEFVRRECPHIFLTVSPVNSASMKLVDTMSFHILDILCLRGLRRYLLYRNLRDLRIDSKCKS